MLTAVKTINNDGLFRLTAPKPHSRTNGRSVRSSFPVWTSTQKEDEGVSVEWRSAGGWGWWASGLCFSSRPRSNMPLALLLVFSTLCIWCLLCFQVVRILFISIPSCMQETHFQLFSGWFLLLNTFLSSLALFLQVWRFLFWSPMCCSPLPSPSSHSQFTLFFPLVRCVPSLLLPLITLIRFLIPISFVHLLPCSHLFTSSRDTSRVWSPILCAINSLTTLDGCVQF